jgi:hypothetical protein
VDTKCRETPGTLLKHAPINSLSIQMSTLLKLGVTVCSASPHTPNEGERNSYPPTDRRVWAHSFPRGPTEHLLNDHAMNSIKGGIKG